MLRYFIIACGLLLAHTADADLIGSFTFRASTGGGMQPGVHTTGLGISLRGGDYQSGPCVGCNQYLLPMSVSNGTFEFNRANSPGFEQIVTLLTDSRNDLLHTSFSRYMSNGSFAGGGGGNFERTVFTTLLTPDLVSSIDAIRITFNLGYRETASSWNAAYEGTWEFFGTPGPMFNGPYHPSPSTVPEPATMSMMLALFGLACAARRGHKSNLTLPVA